MTLILPQPSVMLGMSGVPMSTALLTSKALAMAGLGLPPPLNPRHHWVISTTEPEVWGAAIEVPLHQEYMPLVPAIADVHCEAPPCRRAEAMSEPGTAIVGTHRPSTAGPRLEKLEMPSMSLPPR